MKHSKQFYNELYNDIYIYSTTSNKSIKELATQFNLDRHTLSKALQFRGFISNKHGKYFIDSKIFNKIDTEEKAYWLGFLYADGCITEDKRGNFGVELTLKESDYNHLVKFKEFLSSEHKIYYRANVKAYRIIFKDKEISNDLINLGCIPRKSLILKFPTKEQVSDKFLKDFVRGYVDGDGSIYTSTNCNRNYYGFSLLGTREFLEGLIPRLGLPTRNLYIKNTGAANNYFISYTGNYCIQLLDFLYKDCKIVLNRKYEKYLEISAVFNRNIENYKRANTVNPSKKINFMGNTVLT